MRRGAGADTGRMWNTSRGLRETVIRAMAKVGLVWAVAVLGALFIATSAQSQQDDAYSLSSASAGAQSAAASVTSGDTPRTAGLALALVVLGGGVTVLAVGRVQQRVARAEPPMVLGYAVVA